MQTFQPHPHLHAGIRPESEWRRGATEFAQLRNLPADEVLRGAPFTCNASVFRLQYNAEVDAQGLVVLMELGEIPAETAHIVRMEMLSNNARRPSALLGYFGMFPGTQRGAYCVRLDLKKSPEPASAIGAVVESLASSVESSFASLKEAFQLLTGIDPDLIDPASLDAKTQ